MRDFFGYILIFIFFSSIISTIFFWIRKKFTDKTSEKRTAFSKYKNYSIGIAVLSFVIFAAIAPPSEKNNQPSGKNNQVTENKPMQTPSKSVEPEKNLNLGFTAEQFRAKFNDVVVKSDVDKFFLIGNTTLQTGSAQDIFQYNFSENLILQGSIDKSNGLVKEVWFFSSPKTNVESMQLLTAYALLIGTVNPELNLTERGNLLKELKISSSEIESLKTSKGIAFRGNVKYTVQFLDGIFQFIASAKDI